MRLFCIFIHADAVACRQHFRKKNSKNDAHNIVGINEDFTIVNETTCDISNLVNKIYEKKLYFIPHRNLKLLNFLSNENKIRILFI